VAAQLIREGKQPYVDFFYQHPPVYAYLLAAWMGLLGDSWRSAGAAAGLFTAGAVGMVAGYVGSRVPLHCSAIGKLFLALAPASRRQRLLRAVELRLYTEHTITDRGRLAAELAQIRKEQVSFDRQEFLLGVICAAVPVIDRNGELLAAVAVQAPVARMMVETARGHLPTLRRAAAELAEVFQDE